MELSTSLPSLSSPPPPSPSTSKSSSVYSVVHPVPDPTAQAGFSSVALYTAGHKDKIQKDSSTLSSYTDSEKPEQMSSLRVDSSTCNNKTSTALSPTCFESQQISSPLSNSNCENGPSSSSVHPVSLLNRENYERSRYNLESEPVHKTAQEKFDDNKVAENEHMKVTVPSRISKHPASPVLITCRSPVKVFYSQ